MKPYKLLENILRDIEEGIKNNITANTLSVDEQDQRTMICNSLQGKELEDDV